MQQPVTISEIEQLQQNVPDQSWESHIVVPLTQNLGAGICAAIILVLLTYSWDRLNYLAFARDDTLIWSGICGAILACAMTIIRFYADEIGLLTAAYRAGQRSMHDEIQRLNRQISLLEQSPGQPADVTAINKRLGIMQGDYQNAERLLEVLLSGGSVSRDSDDHGLTRRPLERAVRLLEKSKIYNHPDRVLLITNRNQAKTTLSGFWQEQYERAQANQSFQPAWW